MIIYLQVFLFFLFSVVISSGIGFVSYLVVDKMTSSTKIKHITGGAVSALTGYFVTELFIFSGVWHYYVGTILLAVLLYFLFVL